MHHIKLKAHLACSIPLLWVIENTVAITPAKRKLTRWVLVTECQGNNSSALSNT